MRSSLFQPIGERSAMRSKTSSTVVRAAPDSIKTSEMVNLFDKLSIEQFSQQTTDALEKLIDRSMDFQCSIQDGQLWLTAGDETLLIETIKLK